MRVWLTGASGFVGSAFAEVLGGRHGHELLTARVELTDPDAVAAAADAFAPEAIVHCAILKDFDRIDREPSAGWTAYVGTTRHLADAANRHGAQLVLVSSDWVFDGRTGGYAEDDTPGPVNAYGYLKAASELIAVDRARRGAVARIAGVQGIHRARPDAPTGQDAGFGGLVLAVVAALERGERFRVWDAPGLNAIASPILSTDAGDLVDRMLLADARGVCHCAGAEAIHRVDLARRAAEAFDLDASLLDVGLPPPAALAGMRAPHDTSLRGDRTARRLGVQLPDVDQMLARLREERLRGQRP